MLFGLVSSHVLISIVIYTAIMTFFIYKKPAIIYDHDKKRYKPFTTEQGGTIYPIWMIAIFMGIVSYCVAVWLDRFVISRQYQMPQQPPMHLPEINSMNTQPYVPPNFQMLGGGMSVVSQPPPPPMMNTQCGLGTCYDPSMFLYRGGGGYGNAVQSVFQNVPKFNVPQSQVWKNF